MTAGPYNTADEISANTKTQNTLYSTLYMVWQNAEGHITQVSHRDITKDKPELQEKDLVAEKPSDLLGQLVVGWGEVIDHINQVFKHIEFFLLLLLVIVAFDELWTEEFTNQIKHSDVLLWIHKSPLKAVMEALPTPFGALTLADNDAWCTICVHSLNCLSKGRISRTGHIGLSLPNSLWMLLMHVCLLDWWLNLYLKCRLMTGLAREQILSPPTGCVPFS